MEPTLDSTPTVQLFGVKVHAVTMEQTLGLCRRAIQSHRRLMISVVNAAKIVNMHRQPLLRDDVVGADLVLADGMAVVWASRILCRPLPERVTGIDLFEKLLAAADEQRFSVYFLGATEEVLAAVLERVRSMYPNLQIAGGRNGYFRDDQFVDVAEAIGKTSCDLLFVGMSSPRKERFLADWGRRTGATVCHGVGGSFDVFAGKVKRAPPIWQRLGMEWLYRVQQEPRRMWRRYFVTNLLFSGMLLRQLLWRR